MGVTLDGLFNQNDSYEYDANYEYKDNVEETGSQSLWIPVLFSVVFVVGLLGNVLVLAALAQRRHLWTISDTFILHLGVTDILLLVMLPFWAAQTTQHCGWCYGIFCKLLPAVFNFNFCCGIFLLVCISLDHYLSTSHAVRLYSQTVPSLVHVSCFAVWLISLLFTIPDWIFIGHKEDQAETPQCSHNYPESKIDWHLFSRLFHHILCFLLPTATLIMCWSFIVLQHSSKGLFRQRRIMVILPVVVVFLLCWMPYNITLFVDTFHNYSKERQNKSGNPEGSLKKALLVTSALGCIHACLRPLLYLILNEKFRKQILSLLRCTTLQIKGSMWELGVGEEAPHDQAQSEELRRMTEDHVQSVQSR
ncbi:C-X-C chemokine receptor type 3-like [Melanotaenia boesemani]|uniref:C-X-C chemokine receptor type 3-like n=1 Tax=Melanotaenia boesemani TaxID=1250792 RepID=UPI001C047D08|nr:C-X-C chemokine receptor type 3-like [Melanotaenia boesemani]XP_041843042.1 C-X-C chemokine receptor type 3-like [Melanotaenia boesemani]